MAQWHDVTEMNSSWNSFQGYPNWSSTWDPVTTDFRMQKPYEYSQQTALGHHERAGSVDNYQSTPNNIFDAPFFYELSQGQSWESIPAKGVPMKQVTPMVHQNSKQILTNPTSVEPSNTVLTKPAIAPTQPEWLEVTSAEGWIVDANQVTPTTPTKGMKLKQNNGGSTVQAPATAFQGSGVSSPTTAPPSSSPPSHPPHHQQQPSSTPTSPSHHQNINNNNNKRHHDIEDELGHQDRYKTELCRSWHDSGTCRYGSKCQFAHGTHELRPVMRHPKYKTELCRSWVETRSCPYGRRCRFIHQDQIHSSQSHQSQHPSNINNNNNSSQQLPSSQFTQSSFSNAPTGSHNLSPNIDINNYNLNNAIGNRQNMPPSSNYNSNQFILNSNMSISQHPYQIHPSSLSFYDSSPPPSYSRSSMPPYFDDTYHEDQDDDLDFGPLNMTPLIGQLNLSADPIPNPNNTSNKHAPIGSTSQQETPTIAPSHGPIAPPLEPVGSEKAKKKKSGRLGIFQRLSNK